MIVAYDPRWPETFAAQAQALKEALSSVVSDVHHVGSTSVPGLSARPIIDIFLMLRRELDDEEMAKVVALGFDYRGDGGIPGGYFFVRDDATIYAFVAVHPAGHAMRHFRDHLIARPEELAEYDAAKRRLEAEYDHDPAAYEQARDRLLLEYDKKAAMWAAQEERKRHEASLHRHFDEEDDGEGEEGEGLVP
jgi:GrpB-like predicted nucleotidyltransferase (UPF0157 family)